MEAAGSWNVFKLCVIWERKQKKSDHNQVHHFTMCCPNWNKYNFKEQKKQQKQHNHVLVCSLQLLASSFCPGGCISISKAVLLGALSSLLHLGFLLMNMPWQWLRWSLLCETTWVVFALTSWLMFLPGSPQSLCWWKSGWLLPLPFLVVIFYFFFCFAFNSTGYLKLGCGEAMKCTAACLLFKKRATCFWSRRRLSGPY